jgi:hypothetical protein
MLLLGTAALGSSIGTMIGKQIDPRGIKAAAGLELLGIIKSTPGTASAWGSWTANLRSPVALFVKRNARDEGLSTMVLCYGSINMASGINQVRICISDSDDLLRSTTLAGSMDTFLKRCCIVLNSRGIPTVMNTTALWALACRS